MNANQLSGLLALNDAFGSLAATGSGRPYQSRSLPFMVQQAQQQESRAAAAGALDAMLNPVADANGGPQDFNRIPPQIRQIAQALPPEQGLQVVTDWAAQSAMPSADNRPASVREFEYAQNNPAYGAWVDRNRNSGDRPMSAVGKLTADYRAGLIDQESYAAGRAKLLAGSGFSVTTPDGTTIQYGSGQAGPKLTETESKSLIYFDRANAAEEVLNQFETELTSLAERAASGVPVVGNYLNSPEFQQANQAGREFLAAILRKDTGAAITNQEFELYGPMFLPQPGDGPEVLAQKRESRRIAVDAIEKSLGAGGAVANPRTGGIEATPLPPIGDMSDEELDAAIRAAGG